MNIARILATKSPNVITVSPKQTIREAIALLAGHNIGALVAVDEKRRPVGLLSERDIIRHAAQDEEVMSKTVDELMTKNVITGEPHDDLRAVAHTMTEKHFRHLPITEKGELIGIVSIGDLVKAERDQYEGEVYTLQSLILEADS